MRIILADPHPQVLLALKTMLQEKKTFELAGEASDAESLLAQVESAYPDLVLVDWELPGRSIEELIARLHVCIPRPIVMVMSSQPEYGRRLLQAGADVFVSKADDPDWLVETLEQFDKRFRKKKAA